MRSWDRSPEVDARPDGPNRFLKWLESNAESQVILKRYLTSEHWLMDWIYRGQVLDDANQYAEAYRTTFDEDVPRSDLRTVRTFGKDLRVVHKTAAKLLSDAKADKIDISTPLSNVATVAWIAFLTPTSIAVYGYLYSWVYFGHFGIDTAIFFSTGDYIAYSINHVNFLAVALVVSAASILSVIRDTTALPAVAKHLKDGRLLRRARFIVAIISLSMLVYFWTSPQLFFFGLACLSPILALGHRFWYSVIGRHVQSGPFVGWLAGTLLTCGLVVLFYAKSQAYAIDERTPTPFLVETTGRTYSDANYKVVGAASRYVFLVGDGNAVEVVPSRTVTRVMISNRSDGIVSRFRHWGLERFRRAVAPDEASSRDGDP